MKILRRASLDSNFTGSYKTKSLVAWSRQPVARVIIEIVKFCIPPENVGKFYVFRVYRKEQWPKTWFNLNFQKTPPENISEGIKIWCSYWSSGLQKLYSIVKYFPVNFSKIFRKRISEKTSGRLLMEKQRILSHNFFDNLFLV